MNYYEPYINEINEDRDKFLSSENDDFAEYDSLYKKLLQQYLAIIGYVKDYEADGSFLNGDDQEIVNDAIFAIRSCMNAEDFDAAMYYIVAVQLYIGMSVKFKSVLVDMYDSDFSIESLLGIDDSKTDNPRRRK